MLPRPVARLPRLLRSSHVPKCRRLSTAPAIATTRVTTLSNGLRVATEDLPGHFYAVGVYVDAGTRNEDAETEGVAHLLDRMAFKVGYHYWFLLTIR